jgi:hypothetical protein
MGSKDVAEINLEERSITGSERELNWSDREGVPFV